MRSRIQVTENVLDGQALLAALVCGRKPALASVISYLFLYFCVLLFLSPSLLLPSQRSEGGRIRRQTGREALSGSRIHSNTFSWQRDGQPPIFPIADRLGMRHPSEPWC